MGCTGSNASKQELKNTTSIGIPPKVYKQAAESQFNIQKPPSHHGGTEDISINTGTSHQENERNHDLDHNNKLFIKMKTQISQPQDYSKWKEDKQKIFSTLTEIFSKIGSNDGLYLATYDKLLIYKDDYDKFEINRYNQVSFLKKSHEVNWNKKPYSEVHSQAEKVFNSDREALGIYKKFDWSSNMLEYEKFDIELNLAKSVKNEKDLSEFKLEKEEMNEPHVILFFTFSHDSSILKFQEILAFQKTNSSLFMFIPIYGEKISKSKEALYYREMLEKFELGDSDVYFLDKKSEPGKLAKRIPFTSNDNKKQVIPLVLLLDTTGYIRKICSPEDFLIDDVKSLAIKKEQFTKTNDDIIKYITQLNSDDTFFTKPCNALIESYKCRIYQYSPNENKFAKLLTFYEPVQVKVYHEPKLIQDIISLTKKNVSSNYLSKFKKNYEQQLMLIINEVNTAKANNGIDGLKYCSVQKKQKKILSVIKEENEKLCPEIVRSSHIYLNLLAEHFENSLHQVAVQSMDVLLTYPFLGGLSFSAAIPQVDSPFSSQISLFNEEKNEVEVINIAEIEMPKLLIIFSYSTNYFEREEILLRFKALTNYIKDNMDRVKILFVFRGEGLAGAEEITGEKIFTLGVPIYVLNSSVANFPVHYSNSGQENCESQLIAILLDSENIVRYCGKMEELNIPETMKSLIEGKTNVVYKPNLPMSKEYFKSDCKSDFNEFFSVLENELIAGDLIYRPFIEFSYNKCCNIEEDNSQVLAYNNLRLKITIKEKHEGIVKTNPKVKEYLTKLKGKYSVFVQILSEPCVSLPKFQDVCSMCNAQHNGECFIAQESDEVLCTKCEKAKGDENRTGNLIYVKCENPELLKDEIIEDHINANIQSDAPIDNLPSQCTICDGCMRRHAYLSMIHFNILSSESNGHAPIVLCEDCFYSIVQTGATIANDKEKRRLKKLSLHNSHVVFRKIKLP